MQRIHIQSVDCPSFLSLWKIYEFSFPLSERRSLDDQIRIFSNETYRLEAWIENEQVVGFIGWWICDGLRFVEHYAIAPEHRSSGYGSSFLKGWMQENDTPVVLEIEPVTDETTLRRHKFYSGLGMKDNYIKHFQPPYHKETGPVELWLMSYPGTISGDTYRKFYQKQCKEIMPECM